MSHLLVLEIQICSLYGELYLYSLSNFQVASLPNATEKFGTRLHLDEVGRLVGGAGNWLMK